MIITDMLDGPKDKSRFWPRRFEEMAEDPIPTTVVNEAVSADNVRALARPNQRSLHAVLCGALINTQALVTRLELGVQVSDARRGAVVKAK